MTERPGLTNPEQAAHAWARYRLLVAWMTTAAFAVSAGAIAWLAAVEGPLGWITMTATIAGVGGSIVMAGALMGLIFLSSGTGHDEDVERID